MSRTTDFEVWLTDNAPDTVEEAYDLVKAADGVADGVYDISMDGEIVLIKGRGTGTTLVLASSSARQAFKRRLEAFNPESDLNWDSAVALHRGMQKRD